MDGTETGNPLGYKRVLLKISGEALMGPQGFGLHPPTVERIAGEVAKVHALGVEVCMVIGGGNIFRGLQGSAQGMERTTADYMGMLATVMNALAMQSALEAEGIYTRVISATSFFFCSTVRPSIISTSCSGTPTSVEIICRS